MSDMAEKRGRRPLKTRNARWARVTAKLLAGRDVSPNLISLLSVVAALVAGGALMRAGLTLSRGEACAMFLIAAVCVQARLLCNMLDGMVAVEREMKSPTGEIFNDLPDRVADVLILVGAGYAVALPNGTVLGGVTIGWVAATLAVMTAYVRVLGKSVGATSRFDGPMAKPHRMFVLTVACVIASTCVWWGTAGRVMAVALGVIAAGSALTCVRRLLAIRRELRGAVPEQAS